MTGTAIIRIVVLTAVVIIALVEIKFAKDVFQIFSSLVWANHVRISHAVGESTLAYTADKICVDKLDISWKPENYSIRIELDPSNKSFKGNVTIEGWATKDTGTIELHCGDLNIHKVSLNSAEIKYHIKEEVLLIVLKRPFLAKNSKFVLHIGYDGVFHESLGIVKMDLGEDRYMIATNLEPVAARRVFPCIDLPQYKAFFNVSVKRPEKGMKVLSNMPEIMKKESSDHDSDWVHFERSPKMPTYLVAFIVTDYVPYKVNGAKRNLTTNINIWVPKEDRRLRKVKFAAAITAELLFHLQNFIGSDFSLPKLDLISTPPFEENVGGMENWGLIVIREQSFMMQERSGISAEMEIIFTITHEVAHNWFGNSLTVNNWCSVWLQESLATYIQAVIPTLAFSNVDMMNHAKWQSRYHVMDMECQSADLRSLNMDKTSNSTTLFDLADYYKGAGTLFMLESVVTRQVFQEALQKFVKSHQFGSVDDTDLWTAVQESVNTNGVQLPSSVANSMYPWVNQVGHPIVHVSRDVNGAVTVVQTLCSKAKEPSNFWIPLTFTTKSNMNFDETQPKTWLSGLGGKTYLNVTLDPTEWIIMNIQNSGVYRVMYDPKTWSLLIDQLMRNHTAIHFVNRAILIDDAFQLAIIGYIKYTIPFRLIGYLGKEDRAHVWEVVLHHLYKIDNDDVLPFEESQLLKRYIWSLLNTIYPKVADWTDYDRNLVNYNERKLRGLIYEVAELFKFPAFRRDAVKFIENAPDTFNCPLNETTGYYGCAPHEVSEHTLWGIALADGSSSLFEARIQHYNQVEDEAIKSEIVKEIRLARNVTRLMPWLATVPVNDDTWDHYVTSFKETWPTFCSELLAYFEKHWSHLTEAYDAYYLNLVNFDPNLPSPPRTKDGVFFLLGRFLDFLPMTETMTDHCYDLTGQAFNVTRTNIYAKIRKATNTKREKIGHDVLTWLRQHADIHKPNEVESGTTETS